MGTKENTLLVVLGPTGVGKTEVGLHIAEQLRTPVISCDSRQFYREMKIGTAAPTKAQLQRATHYFVGCRSVTEPLNAGQFELEVMALLPEIFKQHRTALMVGGSMLYIDAVCKGIDNLPTVDRDIREALHSVYKNEGLEGIRALLQHLDPAYYQKVDLKNHQRILHALEICLMTNQPYSSLRTGMEKERPFNIVKIGLNLPREELYDRINRRVDGMMNEGFEEEARRLYHLRSLNALNTVGYKELFACFDGTWDRDVAVGMIRQNARRYAKKQLTWFNRDREITWFLPDEMNKIDQFIEPFQ